MSEETKILFLAANPLDSTRLRLDEEVRAIDQALRSSEYRQRFELIQHWAIRVNDIQALLMRHQPDIVHFSGHSTTQNEIILEDTHGRSKPVSTQSLYQLFSILSDNVKCVVLNSCYSENQAKAISKSIDYVIGMSKAISDRAAISFSSSFYQSLGFNKSIQSAFELGCLQINLENLQEEDTPKIFTKTPSHKVVQKHQCVDLSSLLYSENYNELIDYVYSWVLSDQIDMSGGWGRSQYSAMEKITGRAMSPLEKREGGITTTFNALRALKNYEGSAYKFRQKNYAKKACKYFLERQNKQGGFGRFVNSLSGDEIHPSLRHTSFAISSLIDLDGPPEAIIGGLKYISRNWTFHSILDDAAPSLAIAGIIYAFDKFISSVKLLHLLTDKEKDDIGVVDWPNTRKLLIRELLEVAKTSPTKLFFPPYGHFDNMVFDTALTTIDLISNPLPNTLVPLVIDILSEIINSRIDNGIPYNQNVTTPDIGLSSYLLTIIVRPGFIESLHNKNFASKLCQESINLVNFILESYQKPKYYDFTECKSFSMILFTKELIP